jgi:hypothetical protein
MLDTLSYTFYTQLYAFFDTLHTNVYTFSHTLFYSLLYSYFRSFSCHFLHQLSSSTGSFSPTAIDLQMV